MTIENLLNIIGGKPMNQAKVKKVESATIYPSKVELGDLFFAYEHEGIERAIENGAYAVVYEGEHPKISDEEIAYIHVDSIKEATIKFLRYILIQKESQIYYFKSIEYSLLKLISHRKSTLFTILPNNWQKSFETILNSDYQIFITNNQEDAQKLSPQFLELSKKADGYIVNDTLLKSTFKIDKFIYQNMDLTPLFFNDLLRVVEFCKANEIDYDIHRVRYTKEFLPYYVEDDLTPVTRGSSEKVLIFTQDTATIDRAIEYLRHQSKWIKSIALTPPKTKLENIARPIWYENLEYAKEILKNEFYNYAFCYNLDPKDILNRDGNQESTLF